MRLAFFGPPGAGKGTQSTLLANKFDLLTISTGNLIRSSIAEKSTLGLEAASYVHGGKLVPGELVRDLANRAIADHGFDNFILDGYPRTIEQAEWLNEFLIAYKSPLQAVISLQVPDEPIIQRLSKRRIHKVTGQIYHLEFFPPPADIDPAYIVQRQDDRPDAIRNRLTIYRRETRPVEEYYRRQGILAEIPGVGSVEEIQEVILNEVAHYYSLMEV